MNSQNVPSSLRILLNPVTFKKDRLILKHRVRLNLRFLVITRKAGFGESELNRCLSQLTPVAQQAGRHNTLVKKYSAEFIPVLLHQVTEARLLPLQMDS